eukprot:gene29272-12514_t
MASGVGILSVIGVHATLKENMGCMFVGHMGRPRARGAWVASGCQMVAWHGSLVPRQSDFRGPQARSTGSTTSSPSEYPMNTNYHAVPELEIGSATSICVEQARHLPKIEAQDVTSSKAGMQLGDNLDLSDMSFNRALCEAEEAAELAADGLQQAAAAAVAEAADVVRGSSSDELSGSSDGESGEEKGETKAPALSSVEFVEEAECGSFSHGGAGPQGNTSLYRQEPDFAALAQEYPNLEQYIQKGEDGTARFDYSSWEGSKTLSATLLQRDLGIEWSMPEGHLVPALSHRAKYLHWLNDLLLLSSPNSVDPPRGLDIGCGATYIYCLLGAATYGWRMVGADVSDVALEWSVRHVERNPHLAHLLSVRDSRSEDDERNGRRSKKVEAQRPTSPGPQAAASHNCQLIKQAGAQAATSPDPKAAASAFRPLFWQLGGQAATSPCHQASAQCDPHGCADVGGILMAAIEGRALKPARVLETSTGGVASRVEDLPSPVVLVNSCGGGSAHLSSEQLESLNNCAGGSSCLSSEQLLLLNNPVHLSEEQLACKETQAQQEGGAKPCGLDAERVEAMPSSSSQNNLAGGAASGPDGEVVKSGWSQLEQDREAAGPAGTAAEEMNSTQSEAGGDGDDGGAGVDESLMPTDVGEVKAIGGGGEEDRGKEACMPTDGTPQRSLQQQQQQQQQQGLCSKAEAEEGCPLIATAASSDSHDGNNDVRTSDAGASCADGSPLEPPTTSPTPPTSSLDLGPLPHTDLRPHATSPSPPASPIPFPIRHPHPYRAPSLPPSASPSSASEDSDLKREREIETFSFTMCNPPVFSSVSEALRSPSATAGGTEEELLYPGGEMAFILRMVEDSVRLGGRVHWYSTMVNKKATLKQLRRELHKRHVTAIRTTELTEGAFSRWAVAWSFEVDPSLATQPLPSATASKAMAEQPKRHFSLKFNTSTSSSGRGTSGDARALFTLLESVLMDLGAVRPCIDRGGLTMTAILPWDKLGVGIPAPPVLLNPAPSAAIKRQRSARDSGATATSQPSNDFNFDALPGLLLRCNVQCSEPGSCELLASIPKSSCEAESLAFCMVLPKLKQRVVELWRQRSCK